MLLGKFFAKVYKTSDNKKLKNNSKVYTYGTVSIRDPKLTEHAGKEVIVRVYSKEKNKKVKKNDK